MRLMTNSGTDRVVDELRARLARDGRLDIATSEVSLYAYVALREHLAQLGACSLLVPESVTPAMLLGGVGDRSYRNRLDAHVIAREFSEWISEHAEVRRVPGALPQSAFSVDGNGNGAFSVTGACSFTTPGLGITPGSQFAMVQASEVEQEALAIHEWLASMRSQLDGGDAAKHGLLAALVRIAEAKSPQHVYLTMLDRLFGGREGLTPVWLSPGVSRFHAA